VHDVNRIKISTLPQVELEKIEHLKYSANHHGIRDFAEVALLLPKLLQISRRTYVEAARNYNYRPTHHSQAAIDHLFQRDRANVGI
jgi:hypothetical protein